MRHHAVRAKRLLLLMIVVCATLTAQAQICPGAPYTCPTIDGNPNDWPAVLSDPDNTITEYKLDPYNSSSDDIWTGGSADNDADINNNWHHTLSGANAKNDLGNTGIALIGHTVYFFADRRSTNGDAKLGIWILKSNAGLAPDGTWDGTHTDGDILLNTHFENGGTVAEREIYRWVGDGITGSLQLATNQLTTAALNFVVSTGGETIPGSFSNPAGPTGTYLANQFVEGFLDLDSLVPGAQLDLCFATFVIETGNSQSVSSSLEDFVAGRFGAIPDSMGLTPSSFCANQTGTLTGVTATGSELGVSYQLYSCVNVPVQGPQAGTGLPITWTGLSGGCYYVVGTNSATGCGDTSAQVQLNPCPAPAFVSPPGNTTVACGGVPSPSSLSYTNGGTGACLSSGTATSTLSTIPGACGGTVTETWTASTICGTITHTRTITVTPADLPTFSAPPANTAVACGTVLTGSSLAYTNGLTGGCLISGTGTSTFSAQVPAGACGGTIVETWRATDVCGRTLAPVTRTITVNPAPLPAFITPPANTTVACGATPAPGVLSYTNNAGGSCLISGTATSTFSTQVPAGACGGTIVETWRATDACGRTLAPVSRTITVSPAALPTFSAPPANTTVACGAVPATSNLSYSNNAAGSCLISGTAMSTMSAQVPAGACGGTIVETWNATDACGRTLAPVSRTITVSPAPLPTFSAPPANTTVACGAVPATSNLSYSNNASGSCLISGTATSTQTAQVPAGNCGGTIVETWRATDACGRTLAPVSRTITVSPAALPTFSAPPANTTVACGAVPAPSNLNYSNGASGGCLISGTATSTQTAQVPAGACGGTIVETWNATDACGRTLAPVSRTITVSPAALPTFATPPANTTVACGTALTPSSLSYTNGLTGGCLVSGSNTSTFSAQVPAGACGGTIVETWRATDACGRTLAPVSRTITVSPAALPTFEPAPSNTTVACGAVPAPSSLNYTNGLTGGCLISGTATSTLSAQVPAGACGGTIVETWRATDACGRTLAPVSRTITVSPAALPAFIAPPANTTVACGAVPAPGVLSYTNGAAGGCLISGTATATHSAQIPAGNCGGTIVETWNATDACGRTLAPVSRTITVSPAAIPTFSAPPANTTVACGAAPAPSNLSYSNGASGGCLISGTATSTQTAQVPAGACGGTIVETWRATDACGRTLAPVSRTITVSPAALPTFSTPPGNTTVACGTALTPSSLNYTNGLTGGCLVSGSNTSTFSAQVPAGACGGTIVETWNATDACGRTLAPVSRTITVSPAALPTFSAPPANTTVACGAVPAPSSLNYTNGLTGGCLISGTATSTQSAQVPAGACGGTIVETWRATDACGRTLAPVTRTITVSPAALPAFIAPPANTTVACGSVPTPGVLSYTNGLTGGCLISGTATATHSAQVPAGACGGTIVETWNATDACGRTLAPVSRTITVSPAALPTFSTPPANTTVACGAVPAPSNLSYSNGASGGCLISGTATSTQTAQVPAGACGGTIVETWRATDACGRTLAPVSRTITVSPAALPTFATPPANTTVACGTALTPSSLNYTNGLTGGCLVSGSNTSTFSAQVPAGACGGTIVETWNATDACGRTLAPVSRTITVSPAALPTFSAPPANTTVACGAVPGPSSLNYTNGLTGGCLISGTATSTLSAQVPAGACGGTIVETWRATDACGRTLAPVSRTITVSPAALPAFIAPPANTTVACGSVPNPGILSYTNGLTGGCLISGTATATHSAQVPAGACGGTIVETWNATDACGRTLAPVSRTITVSPAALPTFSTPPANTTVACSAVPAPSNLSYSNGASGGCLISGTATSTQTAQVPAGACGGTIVETWRATDACGRTLAPVSRTITVSPAAVPTFSAPPANTTVACGAVPAPSNLNYSNGASGGCLISGTATSTQTAQVPAGACGGTIVETWRATDACGRTLAPVSRTITVSPAALPTFSAPPANTTVACGAVPAPSSLNYTNGLTGGCLISGTATSTLSAQVPAGACGGTIVETWRATDACGRTLAPVSRTITVSPAAAPEFDQINDTTIACNGIPVPSVLNYTNGLTGGCLISGTATSTLSPSPLPTSGSVTETWTVVECGQTITRTRMIMIPDCGINYGTYSQGYYGNKNGNSCDGMIGARQDPQDLMTYLLGTGGMELGRPAPWNSIIIPGGTPALAQASAAIINSIMPGGGTAKALTFNGNIPITTAATPGNFKTNYLTKQGRINNILISQTLAVMLAARMSNVDNFPIEHNPGGHSWFQTQATTDSACVSFTPIPCTADSFYFDQALVDYLTQSGLTPATVADLINLANGLLSGQLTPGGIDNVPGYGAVTSALATVIDGFHGWRHFTGSYGTNLNAACYAAAKMSNSTQNASQYTVYPNPNNGSFIVALAQGVENADIAILDLTGKVMEKRTGVSGMQQFNMDRAALGMYMVQITIGKETFRTKISIL